MGLEEDALELSREKGATIVCEATNIMNPLDVNLSKTSEPYYVVFLDTGFMKEFVSKSECQIGASQTVNVPWMDGAQITFDGKKSYQKIQRGNSQINGPLPRRVNNYGSMDNLTLNL